MRQTCIILIIILVACGQSKEEKIQKNNGKVTNYLLNQVIKKQANNSLNTELIATSCAIIISPTTKKIENLKSENEEEFYVIADDNEYYVSNARNFLDSMKVKIQEVEANGVLKFKLENGNITTVDLNKYTWGILLFDGKSNPKEMDITDPETEYNNYLKKPNK